MASATNSNTATPPLSQASHSPISAAALSAAQLVTSAAVNSTAGASSQSQGSSSSSQFQRLKVEDALSYLDQVKLQFGNQPQVYNDFLDIMKEFKSQSIDTPGVISRVSNLFKGHPDLIVGFNTFLPPGFKIEVHQNEINISGPAQHSVTLAKIAQAHNSSTAAAIEAAKAEAALSSATTTSAGGTAATTGSTGSTSGGHQPVEFNHAINYVNKIKNRFQNHPDIYKAFLEILHKYQKEQRILKEGGNISNIPLNESEVYMQVSNLFENQEDLLSEFGQFLPDATASFGASFMGPPPTKKPALSSSGGGKGSKPVHSRKASQSGSTSSGGGGKKPKSSAKDVLAEAAKHTNYTEVALFDKIRRAFKNPDIYDNFLRCLVLFNEEIVSRQELVHLVTPFLGKFPELLSSFKTLLGFKDPSLVEALPSSGGTTPFSNKERVTEFAAEIDYKSLKRHGASYRALPKTYAQPKCSGRSHMCQDVLNDTWVSFPMWSEDSTFEGTRKTQYEEYIFRCEDERFELDVVLETNLSAIRYLEAIQKKMSRMSSEELTQFTLDSGVGGRSEILQRKAIHRIYGDKAADIVDGLVKNPNIAVPVVLKRLKSKQEEWLEAQKSFNKTWRDQLEKYYLKSLDHQGINFKQVDTRAMRSKSLITELETVFDERQEQLAEGGAPVLGPHLLYSFPSEGDVFNDAVGLVMYYTKRASSLQHSDALKIRSLLTMTLADFFFYPRAEVSSEDDLSPDTDSDSMEVDITPTREMGEASTPVRVASNQDNKSGDKSIGSALVPEVQPHFASMDYHVMFTNSVLYTFFRLFQFLCERLNKVYQSSLSSIAELESHSTVTSLEELNGGDGVESAEVKESSVALQLGLRKPPDIKVEEYYPTFLNMAKNFMEGNIDTTTYEDTCREMFGVNAYVVFTIDRLVQNIVRQLHAIISEESCYKMMELYTSFVENIPPSFVRGESRLGAESAYQRKAESLMGDDNCCRVVFKDYTLTFELLDTDETPDTVRQDVKKWHNYLQAYSRTGEEAPPEMMDIMTTRTVFLKRSLRKCSMPPLVTEEEVILSILPNMETSGAIEFKMDKKSYRMVPLANSEDYLYNKNSLDRAREVNPLVFARKKTKFQEWLKGWCADHVTTEDSDLCTDWFLGKGALFGGDTPLTERREEQCIGQSRNKYITS
ncbi:paired amphipathic helix protein Sin3a-like isoform X2 [Halichondria panicea]|uniref:paired amphipathic helix protein Sin3a-like isoform X2 n=1 Tax=Halichondria panicea TaxID=6063 RepID=UPI00312B530F